MSRAPFHKIFSDMKMHQFAFIQKCPALTSTALPPSPKHPVDVKRGESEYVDDPLLIIYYFSRYYYSSKGTFESNLVLIHRVYCCSWDGCFTIRKKNRGHCDFFPFNRNLKVNSRWEIHINRAQEILAGCCLLSDRSNCSRITSKNIKC